MLARVRLDGPVPGLAALERVARLALAAKRCHGRLLLSRVPAELAAVLELAGLGVEVRRQAEGREQWLEIREREEVAEGGDPPAGDLENLDAPR